MRGLLRTLLLLFFCAASYAEKADCQLGSSDVGRSAGAAMDSAFCTQGIVSGPYLSYCCHDFLIAGDSGYDSAYVCVPCSIGSADYWMSLVGERVSACGYLQQCIVSAQWEFCVTEVGPVEVENGSWGRIKALYR